MKKKAGIIVGATVAGLLAASPLAFADDSSGGANGGNGNNISVPLQACNNDGNVAGGQLDAISLAGLGTATPANGDACGQPSQAGDAGN